MSVLATTYRSDAHPSVTRPAVVLRPADGEALDLDLGRLHDPATAAERDILASVDGPVIARFDTDEEWIEMWLRSTVAQEVTVPDLGLTVAYEVGEAMRTEVSAKFRRQGGEARQGGADRAPARGGTGRQGGRRRATAQRRGTGHGAAARPRRGVTGEPT